jgi:hypothetical protein
MGQQKRLPPIGAEVPQDDLPPVGGEVQIGAWTAREAPPKPAAAPAPAEDTWGGMFADLGIGMVKGATGTFVNLGELVHKIPGVSSAIDALYGVPGLSAQSFEQGHQVTTPSNTTQSVGKAAEQVAEMLVPGRAITSAATATAARAAPSLAPVIGRAAAQVLPRAVVEGVGGAAMAAAQGGSPVVGGVLGGTLPVAGSLVGAAAPGLKEKAVEKVVQALGPTKERFKAIAARIAPEMLKRGLGGSREALQAQAEEMLEQVGTNLDTALAQYGGQGVTSTQPIVAALEAAKDPFRTVVQGAKGPTTVVFDDRVVGQLTRLQDTVTQLGPNPTVNQLRALRMAWDKIVDQAGGFAHRAGGAIGVPLKDQSEAWAKREGAGAIRELLAAEVPDLAAINKEWSFWKNLDDVVTQTLQRTQPQGPGLGQAVAKSGLAAAGAAVGAPSGVLPAAGGAVLAGQLGGMIRAAVTSPRWRLVDARLRNQLADALMTGKPQAITTALGQITAVTGAKAAR